MVAKTLTRTATVAGSLKLPINRGSCEVDSRCIVLVENSNDFGVVVYFTLGHIKFQLSRADS